MAKLGFYNIVTIECLSREYTARQASYCPMRPEQINDTKKEQTEERKEQGPGKKRQQKQKDKEAEKIQKLITHPNTESRGHTGYLTFATKF